MRQRRGYSKKDKTKDKKYSKNAKEWVSTLNESVSFFFDCKDLMEEIEIYRILGDLVFKLIYLLKRN